MSGSIRYIVLSYLRSVEACGGGGCGGEGETVFSWVVGTGDMASRTRNALLFTVSGVFGAALNCTRSSDV
jgi:hypothetical protein